MERSRSSPPPNPATATVEDWCRNVVLTVDLAEKLAPAAVPDRWAVAPEALVLAQPGRPAELRVTARSPGLPHGDALRSNEVRARVLHTFLHHELQAAELFCWALLAFPETPRSFRAGLVRLALEELEHARLYDAHLRTLGARFGDFAVRDWLWQRGVTCAQPAAFVALQGLGLEGANLEHTQRFAVAFRAAGDEAGARLIERVGAEEIGHVRFALHWFEHFTGRALDYDAWRDALPRPLTPALLQGRPLNRPARRSAGFDESFLRRLEAEPPTTKKARR